MRTDATITVEQAWALGEGMRPALRIVVHDEEGKKPRGKAGKGFLIVAKKGQETWQLFEQLSGFLKQEGSWGEVKARFEEFHS